MTPTPTQSTTETSTFHERLRKFKALTKMSTTDLADKLHISPTTLHRIETGSIRPSTTVSAKLEKMGFGTIATGETSITAVPRLKTMATNEDAKTAALKLRNEATITIGQQDNSITVLPAPFVRNGPPDQDAFLHRLLEMQAESTLSRPGLYRRLSMIEEVAGFESTSQHRLEKPRTTAMSWNSNYGSHGWHRYVGRFPSHVIRALLNHFDADSSSVVCDPFAGSGTTAVECRLLGIPFVGIEICPLSAMMTRTKAAFPSDPKPLQSLTQEFRSFYEKAWQAFANHRNIADASYREILDRGGNKIPTFANIERWFSKEALLGTSISVEFAMTREGFLREAVLLALSAKMRSIGNVDVDVVRAEYRKTPRSNVNVANMVVKQLTKMVKDIRTSAESHEALIGTESDITVHEGSVLDVDLGEQSVSHIITSPPYGIEAISYLRTHLLSYRSLVAHLKHDPYATKEKTIGSEYLEKTGHSPGTNAADRSPTFQDFFERNQHLANEKFNQRHAAMMQFCDDMIAVGEKINRWLKPGGQIAFVIGNKRLGDEVIPMGTIIGELFYTCGLQLTDTVQHKLKTNNSNSQVPWQERAIQAESIMLLKKPKA